MSIRKLAAAAALALAAAVLPAERVTVDRAVELAVANNLGLASERVGLETKKLVRDTAWNRFIPSMTAGTSLTRRNEGADMAASYPRWLFGVSVSATLPLSVALRDGIEATVIDYRNGQLSLETAEKQLSRDVRKSFYNLLLIQENIKLMQQNIDAADRRYSQAKANYQAGLVPEYSVLSAQVALENLKPALEDLRNGYDAALGSFRLTLGVERGSPIEPDGAIEIAPSSLDAKNLIETRLTQRLDIQSLDLALAGLRNGREAAFYQRMTPTLALSFLADPTYHKDPFGGESIPGTDKEWLQSRGSFVVSLTMPLDPLLPHSTTRVDLAKLDSQIRQTELAKEQALQGAALEIETLVRNLDKTRTSISTLELNVGLAERAYQLADEAYKAGGRELLEVQNAELELNKARVEVLKARYSYITGLLDLEYAVNMTLREEGKK